jgi:hypothetical protein
VLWFDSIQTLQLQGKQTGEDGWGEAAATYEDHLPLMTGPVLPTVDYQLSRSVLHWFLIGAHDMRDEETRSACLGQTLSGSFCAPLSSGNGRISTIKSFFFQTISAFAAATSGPVARRKYMISQICGGHTPNSRLGSSSSAIFYSWAIHARPIDTNTISSQIKWSG